MVRVGGRKERSDKKRQVKPLIPLEVKEVIHRISHVTNMPLKDVCEFLVVFVIQEKNTISNLSKYFKRGVGINGTYYTGDINVRTIEKRLKVPSEIVSIKFKREDFENISVLAYALDCTPTRTTAILLENATHNVKAINEYIYLNMVSELTEGQMRELRKVLSYVNHYNDDRSSWMSILSAVVGDIRPATKKLYELVEEFLKRK